MPFEVFDKRGAAVVKDPTVTVLKGGPLALNRPAYYAAGAPEAVELLFDKEEQVIGFREVPADTPHAYPVRNTATNPNQYLISGVAFTKHYEIKTDVSLRYPAYRNDDGILCVKLTGRKTRIVGNRNGKKNGHRAPGQGSLG